MNLAIHNRFAGLGPVASDDLEDILRTLTARTLPRVAAWAKRTVTALPSSEAAASGWRDYRPDKDGRPRWFYPRSNAAERIEAYLWLADKLNDPSFRELAVRYADVMLNDSVRGIYQGREEKGQGGVWYWTDLGLYMTNYTMRVPPAFLALAQATGNARYAEAAELCGRFLVSMTQSCGIPFSGWCPAHPEAGVASPTSAELQQWLPPNRIQSRVGYYHFWLLLGLKALEESRPDLSH